MRTLLPLTLLAAGCWKPRETGPDAMLGQIVDVDGAPISGLSVETVESRWVTEADGRFAVNYKEPQQYLWFEHQGVTWSRFYLGPDEDRTDVRIQLTPLEERTLTCLREACDARLEWELGGGLKATVRARCEPKTEAPIVLSAPAGPPSSATCRAGATAPEEPLHIKEQFGRMYLMPEPVPLSVRLFVTQPPTTGCKVLVDGAEATLQGDGTWLAPAFGPVVAWAVCDGTMGTVQPAYVVGAGQIGVSWWGDAPRADLREVVPWAKEVLVIGRTKEGSRWTMTLPVSPAGVLQLPALDPGQSLTLGFNTDLDYTLKVAPSPGSTPDVLQIVSLPFAADDGRPMTVGLLQASGALHGGELKVEFLEASAESTDAE